MIDRLEINNDWSDIFEQNTPSVVSQQVRTRLLLWLGEWYMDTSDGTPYLQDILGFNTNYDLEIKTRILGTPEVTEIINYSSSISTDRKLSVQTTINTLYGITSLTIG
jgi:hypothetical protein